MGVNYRCMRYKNFGLFWKEKPGLSNGCKIEFKPVFRIQIRMILDNLDPDPRIRLRIRLRVRFLKFNVLWLFMTFYLWKLILLIRNTRSKTHELKPSVRNAYFASQVWKKQLKQKMYFPVIFSAGAQLQLWCNADTRLCLRWMTTMDLWIRIRIRIKLELPDADRDLD